MRAGSWSLQIYLAIMSAACVDLDQDLLSEDWVLSQVEGKIQLFTQLPGSSLKAVEAKGLVQDSLYRWVGSWVRS